jgi:hypothetical protein
VDERMTGGTKRDQPGDVLHAWPAVMDSALAAGPAALTTEPVARQHGLTQTSKIAQGVPALPITHGAQSADGGRSTAFTAKQRALEEAQQELL